MRRDSSAAFLSPFGLPSATTAVRRQSAVPLAPAVMAAGEEAGELAQRLGGG